MTFQVDEAIQPGLTSLNWTSLNIDKYLGHIDKALGKYQLCSCTLSLFLFISHSLFAALSISLSLALSNILYLSLVSAVDLELLMDRVNDLVEFRIEAVLREMCGSTLCILPEDEPVTIEEFVQTTRVNE